MLELWCAGQAPVWTPDRPHPVQRLVKTRPLRGRVQWYRRVKTLCMRAEFRAAMLPSQDCVSSS